MASAGQNSKYKPEYDELIVKLSKTREGRHMYRIASKFDVCFDTLQEWCSVHPSFSAAYTRALNEQRSQLLDLVDEHILNRDLNQTGINLLFRHAGGFAEQRTIKVKNLSKGTLTEKVKVIMENCEEKGMTPDELSKMVSAVGVAAKIDEVTELRKQVEDLEDKE